MLEKAKLDNAVLDVTIRESFKIGINLLTGERTALAYPWYPRVAGGLMVEERGNGGARAIVVRSGNPSSQARWMNATFLHSAMKMPSISR